jgi:hypothetical protein
MVVSCIHGNRLNLLRNRKSLLLFTLQIVYDEFSWINHKARQVLVSILVNVDLQIPIVDRVLLFPIEEFFPILPSHVVETCDRDS